MEHVDEIIDDLMAPDWKFLLEQLYPQLLITLQQTEGFGPDEWDKLLSAYPETILLTPAVTAELENQLREIVGKNGLLEQRQIVQLAQNARAAKKNEPVMADGGAFTLLAVASSAVIALYLINVIGVIVNNKIRVKRDKEQDIPPASDVLKQLNVAQTLKNLPGFSKLFPPDQDRNDITDQSTH